MKRSRIALSFLMVFLLVLSVNVPMIGAEATEDSFKVTGYVLPDVSVSKTNLAVICSDIRVEIEGTQIAASTNGEGYFEFNGVPANNDGYRIKLSKKNYLTRYIDKVQVLGDVQVSTKDAPIVIWPGDIERKGVQDNAINLSDIVAIAVAFNSTPASAKYVRDFDMNLDNAINMVDIVIIAKFFNKASSSYMKYYIPLPVIGSNESLTQLLSLVQGNIGGGYYTEMDINGGWGSGIPVPAATPAPGGPKDYSTVNNQVEGVDEADVVQTDGDYIYQVNKNRIIVARAYPANELEIVNEIKFTEDGSFTPSQLLMGDKKLIVIGYRTETAIITPTPPVGTPLPSGVTATPYRVSPYTVYKAVTKAIIFDIKDKTTINRIREIEIEGNCFSSRKIGSYLYLIANKQILGVDDKPVYFDSRQGDIRTIGLDSIRYFPEAVRSNYMSIVGFNVDEPNSKVYVSSYLGGGRNMYVSQNNIYVAETNYFLRPVTFAADSPGVLRDKTTPNRNSQDTLVYKFAMENGNVTFAGKGEVPGAILNQFSMDEYNGYFRIATTLGNVIGGGSANNLYIADKELKVTGKIENIAPGEKIYSTRFMGDRGYMVTFRKIDPLFVFDLKDPSNPAILGKLKIPGYSDYLHPYDENHIIGFGKDTIESSYGTFAWYQGMKVALFDITDVNNPVEKFKEIIGDRGTDSELLVNHKALLFSKSKNLMAFPVTLKEIPEDIKKSTEEQSSSPQYGSFTFQGAYVYNIDLENGFKLKGRITHIPQEDYIRYGQSYHRDDNYVERAMYINDTLYTLSKGKIKANKLDDLSEIKTLPIPQ